MFLTCKVTLCFFANVGDCPHLYEEASQLSHLVQTAISEKKPTGTANKLTDEQMGRVYQILLSRVKQNLHVLILLTLEGK